MSCRHVYVFVICTVINDLSKTHGVKMKEGHIAGKKGILGCRGEERLHGGGGKTKKDRSNFWVNQGQIANH